ncbi:hypothetical protein NLM27_02915 [Bradyrhizobium sp. CCGB12]|uniref:hypothetical protein n=1 Tax=Bradyrhizobium sp. CCGB12 TaxID=2949632 RepID=UPI0020B35893|nr:hypothetical protein [Bradyrhizobium sp. CCGB12]MCP3387729.1 hypothetical protein [Bradyrhizobium sp. CCGB12]
MTEPAEGDVWKHAQKMSPRVARFVFGGYLVLAAAAIVLSWRVAPSALVPTAVFILVLATIVALLVQALSRPTGYPAAVALWAMLAGCIAVAILFVTSAFFGLPERGATLVARMLKQNELAILSGGDPAIYLGPGAVAIPGSYRADPDVNGDRFDRISELSKRAPLILKGTTVVLDAPAFHFGILRLEDVKLITRGQNVTIEAVRIETAGNVSIEAYASLPSSAPGAAGGQLKLIVYDRIRGQLLVDLSGTSGAKGADGRNGVTGAGGAPGENSAQSLFDCKHGGGPGGPGQPGGKGEDGAPGSQGGDGGTLFFVAADPDRLFNSIRFIANGGEGGQGGRHGTGGPGGPGGPGGHGGGFCGGGQAGPQGPSGPDGRDGAIGKAGNGGSVVKLNLDSEIPQ